MSWGGVLACARKRARRHFIQYLYNSCSQRACFAHSFGDIDQSPPSPLPALKTRLGKGISSPDRFTWNKSANNEGGSKFLRDGRDIEAESGMVGHSKSRKYKWKKCGLGGGRGRDATWTSKQQRSLASELKNIRASGHWGDVFDFLDAARLRGVPLNEVIYGIATSTMAKSGKWIQALSLMNEMRSEGLTPNEFIYSASIEACGKAGEWEQALAIFENMKSAAVPINTFVYTNVIQACGRASQWEWALELIRVMRQDKVPLNSHTYRAAIEACKEAGQWQAALSLLHEMAIDGVEPSLFTYSAAISACGHAGEWERALDLLDELWVAGLSPDVPCYNAGLAALSQVGQVKRSEVLLQEMIQEAKVMPNTTSYCSVITAHARAIPRRIVRGAEDNAGAGAGAGEVEDWDWCPEVMVGKGRVEKKEGSWSRAVELLDEMKRRGVQRNTTAFSAVISACGSAGEWREALRILDLAQQEGVRADTRLYCAAMVACIDAGQYNRAIGLGLSLRPPVPNPDPEGVSPTNPKQDHVIESTGNWSSVCNMGEGARSDDQREKNSCAPHEMRERMKLSKDLGGVQVAGGGKREGGAEAKAGAGAGARAGAGAGDRGRDRARDRVSVEPSIPKEAHIIPNPEQPRASQSTMSLVVVAAARAGLWELAVSMVSEMQAAGLTPSEAILGMALGVCQRAGQPTAAVEVLLQWRRLKVARHQRAYYTAIGAFHTELVLREKQREKDEEADA